MMSRIEVENSGAGDGVFVFKGLDQKNLPEWLQIIPAQGFVHANSKIQIQVLAIVSDKEFYLGQEMVKEAQLQFQWSETLSIKGFGQDSNRNGIIQVMCVKS
eukprot:TRINITY_DN25932_c1_g1_i3.p2 TRINITY_DN25932_c1_g1~~TRINITY_DN25932_c1_g1_i3.p2  ORF type:complete len:102 (-),score=16.07 TRINITY_DN25932_c1_g1_i3:103-408(-)